MELSTYSNERLLNIIKQSYNFDIEQVKQASNLALKKGLISSIEVKKILEQNELKRESKKEANYQRDKKMNMGELDTSNQFTKWFYRFIPFFIILFAIVLYFATGNIFVFAFGALGSVTSRSIFKSKFR